MPGSAHARGAGPHPPQPDRGEPCRFVPIREILDRAFDERYGVAAINIVDDLSLEAVLAAATELTRR